MQKISRRGLGALAATGLSLPYLARAADWPTRTVTLLVPYPPGGPSDVSVRPMVEPLSRILGQPVVIENRAGAGGSIGAHTRMNIARRGAKVPPILTTNGILLLSLAGDS